MDRKGKLDQSSLGYQRPNYVVDLPDHSAHQLPQNPVAFNSLNQSPQNPMIINPRESPQSPQHPGATFNPLANPQRDPSQSYQLPESKSVLKRVTSCWLEFGRRSRSVYQASSEKFLELGKGSTESIQPSLRKNSTRSLDDSDKENDVKLIERLEDYNFLSGMPSTEKSYISIFGRQKSSNTHNRRHSIAEWGGSPNDDPEGYRCAACKQVVHKSCLSKVDKCHGCALPTNRVVPQIVPDPRFGPQTPQPPPDNSICNDYWNLQVTEYPWWVERMTRLESTSVLITTTEGTFLLRWSDNHNQPILSLKAMGEVKHMRVNRQDETGYFFLSEARFFRSIVELIIYHNTNLLSESFQGLERTLIRPVYDTAVVRFTYSAPPNANNHLSMIQGERVVVISREGETRGWWKGRIATRVGYFPKEYVALDNEPFMN